MRRVAGLVALLLMLALVLTAGVSCAQKDPTPQHSYQTDWLPGARKSDPQREQRRAQAVAEQQAARPREQQGGRSDRGAPVAPPKGAQFTIFCSRIQTPGHVEIANRLKGELMAKTGMNGWHVVHEEGQSLLYYGYYRTFRDEEDAREAARAQADLQRVKAINSEGTRLFAGALFVDLESPDPVAPREWNLAYAPGEWSVQIAAYKDSPMRKEAAVEAVREARKQGVEAYFYHGDTVSSVCIGVWPEQAVRVHDSSREVNPSDKLLITPAGMPEVRGLVREKDVKVVQERIEVVDPSLERVMKQYPTHAINGEVMVRHVNGKDVGEPSLLIRIPREEPAADNGLAGGSRIYEQTMPSPEQEREPFPGYPSPSIGTATLPPANVDPAPPQKREPPAPRQQPGVGKLKSIDG